MKTFKMLSALCSFALLHAVSATAGAAEPITYHGRLDYGYHEYRNDGLKLRYFAFSYVGNVYDLRTMTQQTELVIGDLNRRNMTHPEKANYGDYFEQTLNTANVFIVGWFDLNTGRYGYLATVPGTSTVVSNTGEVFTNTGWFRRSFRGVGNSRRTPFVQLGCYRGAVQWHVGTEIK